MTKKKTIKTLMRWGYSRNEAQRYLAELSGMKVSNREKFLLIMATRISMRVKKFARREIMKYMSKVFFGDEKR